VSDPVLPGAPSSDGWVRRQVRIRNRRGLHARAAAKFVKVAGGFEAEVTVRRNDQQVSGLSIMGLMMLGAGPGSELLVAARGDQATAAVDALAALIAGRFDED
jgi:phosphocarrier protein